MFPPKMSFFPRLSPYPHDLAEFRAVDQFYNVTQVFLDQESYSPRLPALRFLSLPFFSYPCAFYNFVSHFRPTIFLMSLKFPLYLGRASLLARFSLFSCARPQRIRTRSTILCHFFLLITHSSFVFCSLLVAFTSTLSYLFFLSAFGSSFL